MTSASVLVVAHKVTTTGLPGNKILKEYGI